MPLVKLETSATIDDAHAEKLMAKLSRTVAEITDKPESYVMVTVQQAQLRMGGQSGPGAFVDVRGIGGLSGEVNNRLSKAVSDLLQEVLQIPPERCYLNFTDVMATNWGWSGKTFG